MRKEGLGEKNGGSFSDRGLEEGVRKENRARKVESKNKKLD